MKRRSFLLSLMLAAGWVGLGVVTHGQDPGGAVSDRYIVTLRTAAFVNLRPDLEDKVLAGLAAEYGIAPNHVFSAVIKGFAGHIPPGLLTELQNDPLVESVTPDLVVTAFGQPVPNGVARIGAPLPFFTGAGVGVAVVDTGLDFNHLDLQPVGTASYTAYGSSAQDDNGHGTHVGGIIAARNNETDVVGVAPDATLYAVKVLDSTGSGYDSDIIGGLNWVAQNAKSATIRVVNMSLGRAASTPANDAPLRTAVQNVVKAGITVVVAAGNDPSKQVKNMVPAGFPEVIAVASTTAKQGIESSTYGYIAADTASFFTTDGALNPVTGVGVTISAPGEDQEDILGSSVNSVGILSLKLGGGMTTMSGTSMASPHVAGVVALLYQQNSSLTPADAKFKVAAGDRVGAAPLDSKTSKGYNLSGYTFDGVREGIVYAPNALGVAPPPPTPDFSLSITPSSTTVAPGGGTTYTVTVTSVGGFSDTVTFDVSGLPSDATATFGPPSVPGSGGSSALTITTTANTAAGTFPLTITGTSTGTSGSLARTVSATLVVATPDFSLSASPSSRTVKRGSTTTYTVTVRPSGGFTGTVEFSVSGLPSGATGTFNPPSVTTSGSSSLKITTKNSTPRDTYPLTITGTSGPLVYTATVSLTVN